MGKEAALHSSCHPATACGCGLKRSTARSSPLPQLGSACTGVCNIAKVACGQIYSYVTQTAHAHAIFIQEGQQETLLVAAVFSIMTQSKQADGAPPSWQWQVRHMHQAQGAACVCVCVQSAL